MTSAFGAVSDNVIELEIVTGRGENAVCSATRDAHVFDAVRAGLGQVAMIIRATRFCCTPTAGSTAVQGAIVVLEDGALSFRLDTVVAFDGSPPEDDALVADMLDAPVHCEVTTVSYLDYLDRLAALEGALRANGQWYCPHPWLMTFVGDRAVESVVSAELDALDPLADLGPLGQVALSPIRRSAISSPLLRMRSDDLCFALNLVRIPTTNDPGDATASWRRTPLPTGASAPPAGPSTRSARSQ
jgi:cytokinin dehydrogenase